uniref:Na_Ca_ex domain-containing protein n=1 Tax=Caenorhabditis tropicalis TaxID=1561998 RepID=A0A1I7UHE7_9PELO
MVRRWESEETVIGVECIPDDGDQCTVQGNWSSTQVCNYVKCNDDSCEGGGYLLWTKYVECASTPATRVLLIIAGVIYMLILFIMVSSAADDFFSPSISSIVAHLRISESVAGVTFMAFGNGAPDVFGAIASVLSSPTPKADLALGELFGAGLFVTTMVLAVTIFTKPFKAEVFSSIRDIAFYLVALSFLALCFVFYDHVELWMPVSFLGIYLLYVCTVILSQILHNRQKREREETEVKPPVDTISIESLEDDDDIYISHGHHVLHAPDVMKMEAAIEAAEVLKTWSFVGVIEDLKEHLKPWPDRSDWEEMNVFQKFICAVNIIPTFFFKLTIPHNEQPWSKPISLIHCLICPVFLLFCIQVCSISPFLHSPGLWLYGLILSFLLLVIVSFFTQLHTEPQFYKGVTSYAGFLMSIAWIYLISSEVVNVATMLGVVSRVSHEVLGLTILAWSNSIGDLIADVSVAKQGYPRMAMAAAIGGQLFNLLIGFGLPFTIAKIQGKTISVTPYSSTISDNLIQMIINPTYRLLMLFLGISLIFTFIAMFAQKFFLRRIHSYFLVFIYISFFIFIGLSLDNILVWN